MIAQATPGLRPFYFYSFEGYASRELKLALPGLKDRGFHMNRKRGVYRRDGCGLLKGAWRRGTDSSRIVSRSE
jgi:hypothetical protein